MQLVLVPLLNKKKGMHCYASPEFKKWFGRVYSFTILICSDSKPTVFKI